MPRGSKVCSNQDCKAICGPRAFVCPKCGTPFKFKNGVVASKEDIRASLERAKAKVHVSSSNEPEKIEYLRDIREYFTLTKPTVREIELFGNNVHVYESKCGKYRVRAYSSFMGVPAKNIHGDFESHETTPYYQLCKYGPNDTILLVRRFKSDDPLVKYHESVIQGVKQEVVYNPSSLSRTSRGERALKKRKRIKN